MASLIRIAAVRVLGARRVELALTKGESKVVDLAPLLAGPAFDSIREDDDLFRRVRVDEEFGALVWPTGADLCPDLLIHDRRPA